MIRVYALTSALALAVVLVGATADAADDKLPTIKEIMKKAHTAKDSLKGSIAAAVKEKKWDEAAKTVVAWEVLGAALAKNTPKKGEPESWKTLTADYNKTLKALEEAIDKKDEKAAKKALGEIGNACKTCHPKHKGK